MVGGALRTKRSHACVRGLRWAFGAFVDGIRAFGVRRHMPIAIRRLISRRK